MFDRLLDASIVASFDASGFRRHARSFVPGDLDVDLRGQELVVTGANAGIGRVVATELARRGGSVWMVCRDAGRGEDARAAIAAETGNAAVRLVRADMSVLGDVRALADALPARIDALVHNAGVLLDRRDRTPDGLERTFATHVGGPMLLTELVADRLAGGRLVWVASGGMYSQRLRLPDLWEPPEPFDGVVAYAQAKRAQVILGELLAERLPAVWTAVMHPGWADTGGVQRSLPTFRRLTRGILRTPAEGADTVVWLALARRGPSGRFWFDRREAPTHLWPLTRESAADRAALWEGVHARIHARG